MTFAEAARARSSFVTPSGAMPSSATLREEHARLSGDVGATRATRWHTQQSAAHRLPLRHPSAVAARHAAAALAGDRRTGARADRGPPACRATLFMRGGRWAAARPGVDRGHDARARAGRQRTTFSLMDAIVLRPYRFAGVDRLLAVTTAAPDDAFFDRENVSPADFRDWQRAPSGVAMGGVRVVAPEPLGHRESRSRCLASRCRPDSSPAGLAAGAGPEFLDEKASPGHHRVCARARILDAAFCVGPAIVGRTVRLDGEPYEVVGVAPEGFSIPLGAEVWAPIALTTQRGQTAGRTSRLIGRLADGASLENARAEFNAIVERQRRATPTPTHRRHAS